MPLFRAYLARNRWKVILGAVVLVAYGMTGGCYTQRLPPAPSAQDAALLAHGPLPYRVIVVPWDSASPVRRGRDPQAYANHTYRWLQSSGAFASVRLATSDDTAADLAASPTGAYCNTAAIPMFTILSLGVIPTIFNDTDCEGAILRPLHPSRGSPDSVVLGTSLTGRVMMGWLAIPVGALPGWTHGEARNHKRYRDHVRLTILLHRSQLAALVGAH